MANRSADEKRLAGAPTEQPASAFGAHWRVTLIYGVFATLWIYLSDSALAQRVSDHSGLAWWSLHKGLAFVAVTTVLLFWLTRRAVEESRGLGDRLIATLESITDGFYTVDNDWRITYINPEGERMLQCDRRQVSGKVLWEAFPQLAGTGFQQQFLKCRREGTVAKFEDHYPPFDRWFAVRVFPSEQGLAIYFTDVTEQRQAQERMARQATLIDLAQDAIVVHDLDQRISSWSQGAKRMFGWTTEEAVGHRLDTMLGIEEPAAFEAANQQVLQAGEWQGELQAVAKSKARVVVDCRWTLVRDAQGQPKSILSLASDITQRKQIETQLLRAQRMDSLGALAGGIAHDLNNMLTPILMSTGLLKLGETDPTRLGLLDTVESSAKRGGDMVGHVLAFARGADGPRQPLSANGVVNEVAKIIRDTFPKNIVLKLDLPLQPCLVTGDPTQLHQVVLNLCVNARDAMPDGGELTMSVAERTALDLDGFNLPEGAYASITVSDTGSGIPADLLEKIFDPFFTTKKPGQGTGLGLASSLSIVKSHGGFLKVSSSLGEGTEFLLLLPSTESLDEPQVEAPDPLPRGEGQLILVVDDEEAVRHLVQRTLERFGYQVVLAEHGAQAVAIYTERMAEIAIVLTDMMMPIMDGKATIDAIRKLNPSAQIVACTGGGSKASELEADRFLVKPFNPAQLLQCLWELRHDQAKQQSAH